MIRYPHCEREPMGFLGPLLALGSTIVGGLMAEEAAEDAAERAEAAAQAQYERQVAAASAMHEMEMEAWRAQKEALREQREIEAIQAEDAALKRAEMFRIVAIAGAVGIGIVGIGLLLR